MNFHSLVTAMFVVGGAGHAIAQEMPAREAEQKAAALELVLVDVRQPEEWAETGVAPGAVLITLQDADFLDQLAAATKGDKGVPVAFICRSGKRSGTAAEKAKAAGYTQVYNVPGGMSMAGGWIDSGLRVEAAR